MRKADEFAVAMLVIFYIINITSILGLIGNIFIKSPIKGANILGITSFVLSLIGVMIMTRICSKGIIKQRRKHNDRNNL